ncbi:hypothetical protein [Microbulbifer hydrolyticus]|uniref:hypothetical protein n=1 Tax=Microbulbifer hydrolyticus TaxID=48074 RepID=UPI001F2493C7|nr:hypothetical protein [Microbulbifer hydrolyticus]
MTEEKKGTNKISKIFPHARSIMRQTPRPMRDGDNRTPRRHASTRAINSAPVSQSSGEKKMKVGSMTGHHSTPIKKFQEKHTRRIFYL